MKDYKSILGIQENKHKERDEIYKRTVLKKKKIDTYSRFLRKDLKNLVDYVNFSFKIDEKDENEQLKLKMKNNEQYPNYEKNYFYSISADIDEMNNDVKSDIIEWLKANELWE